MCDPRARQSHSLHRTAAGVAALALCASACGAGAGAGDSTSADSPLSELFGWNDYDPVQERVDEAKIQELAVVCMADEGFEYQPEVSEPIDENADEDAELYKDPVAYGEKYGYGTVQNYEDWEIEQIQAQIDGVEAPGDTYIDPNEDYITSLSESEVDVYYETLHGESQEWEVDDDGNEIQPPPLPVEDRGCLTNARAEVQGEQPYDDPEFNTRMEEFWTDQQEDPRVAAVNADWKECMADTLDEFDPVEGFSATRPDDMWTYFQLEKSVLTGQWVTTDDPDASDEFDTEFGWGSQELADGTQLSWGGKQHLIEPDQLEGLRSREIETWKKDWDCQKQSGTNDVRIELEQEMVDTIKTEFPDLVTS